MWGLQVYLVMALPPDTACFVGILSHFCQEQLVAHQVLGDVCTVLNMASALQRDRQMARGWAGNV